MTGIHSATTSHLDVSLTITIDGNFQCRNHVGVSLSANLFLQQDYMVLKIFVISKKGTTFQKHQSPLHLPLFVRVPTGARSEVQLAEVGARGLPEILHVAAAGSPGIPVTGAGQEMFRAVDVCAVEGKDGLVGDRALDVGGGALETAGGHEVEETAGPARGDIGAECPAVLDVAEEDEGVGDSGKHGVAVDVALRGVLEDTVDMDLDSAGEHHLQTRGGDDDVGLEGDLLAWLVDLNGFGGDVVDGSSHDVTGAVANGAEEVAIGADAKTLVPWIVRGVEVGIQRIALRQACLSTLAEDAFAEIGVAAEDVVGHEVEEQEAPTQDTRCPRSWEDRADEFAEAIVLRHRGDP